eukprot:280777-Hanusia_phi.AAC.1
MVSTPSIHTISWFCCQAEQEPFHSPLGFKQEGLNLHRPNHPCLPVRRYDGKTPYLYLTVSQFETGKRELGGHPNFLFHRCPPPGKQERLG